MVKEEILEGLRAAVLKGEPLRKAMMSFYNAGYKKQEIEEAARALNALPIQQRTPQQPTQPIVSSEPPVAQKSLAMPQAIPPVQPIQTIQLPPTQIIQSQVPIAQPSSGVVQRVSAYGQKPSPLGLIMTFVLVFFLLFLVGILVAVFLFKDEISNIVGGLF